MTCIKTAGGQLVTAQAWRIGIATAAEVRLPMRQYGAALRDVGVVLSAGARQALVRAGR